MISLYDHQLEAIRKLHTGSILCGGVGTGKSRTSLAYYYILEGGDLNAKRNLMKNPRDLYIITTARKRDTKEWEAEMNIFNISTDPELDIYKNHKVVVDSWNNIKKYIGVKNAFFIFDEQRVIGYGAWTQSFLKITKSNDWILLSATPGDTWTDYIPVFVANGFFKNKREFEMRHVVYDRHCTTYPKIDRFVDTGYLLWCQNKILVDMEYARHTVRHYEYVYTEYDMKKYKDLMKFRWDAEKNEPIENAAQLCYQLRKLVNSDPSRIAAVKGLVKKHARAIIFYNYDYELEILKSINYESGTDHKVEIAEWNGHKHQPIPDSLSWVYLVQYNSGSEGWNCILTDCIIFYSFSYSYRTQEQASGRIDRLNTPYTDLYLYELTTHSKIDMAIQKALKEKKTFNERRFVQK